MTQEEKNTEERLKELEKRIKALEDRSKISEENKIKPNNDWFEQFWKLYPRRIGKRAAEKKFNKIVKTEETFNAVMQGVNNYIAEGNDVKYTAHPTTWLNQGRWEDEVDTSEDSEIERMVAACRKDKKVLARLQINDRIMYDKVRTKL